MTEFDQVKHYVINNDVKPSQSMELYSIINGIEVYFPCGSTTAVVTRQRPQCNPVMPQGFNTRLNGR